MIYLATLNKVSLNFISPPLHFFNALGKYNFSCIVHYGSKGVLS